MNVHEINSAIIRGNFTNEELNTIVEALRYARSRLGHQVKFAIQPGAKVSWNSNKLGGRVVGTVERVKIKNVVVNVAGGGRWNVPANMLTVESK